MRRYSEAVQADVRKRMSPPHRQSVAQISQELGIHQATLYNWRKLWRLQGEVVPASEKDPDSWSAADKFTVVLETAGFNATELSSYCRELGLFTEQVDHWRQTAPNWSWPACLRHLMQMQTRCKRSLKSSAPRTSGR